MGQILTAPSRPYAAGLVGRVIRGDKPMGETARDEAVHWAKSSPRRRAPTRGVLWVGCDVGVKYPNEISRPGRAKHARLLIMEAQPMNPDNPVVKLCIAGTQAEFNGRIDAARALYRQAWEAAQDDYEACIAAHYVARHQPDPHETLRWNREALARAEAVGDGRVDSFYPSLYLNMGQSFERLGDEAEAQRYYEMAAALGVPHAGE